MHADELVRPLSGADWWNVAASGDVPALRVTDGPSGARGQRFVGGPPSVSFPCGAALGATWDVELVERVGAALAAETRAKGAQVLLGPTINLQRTPLGGRHFECFSEDPYLTARVAGAYVRGLQGGGVAACVKHLVANDQEHDRFEISAELDERTLREVSLLPFEHLLRGGAWSTMAAYNRLHGTHCSANERLLTTILRDEWGWDGVVISDWFAVHSTVEPANAGLDLEMPGPALHWGPKLAAAIDDGEVSEAVIEAKRERLAILARRTGADADPPGAEEAGGAPATVSIAREAAAASLVLLRNEGVLPLDRLDRERGAARTQRGSRGDPGRRQRAGDAHRRRHDRRRAAGAAGRSARRRAGHRRQPRHARDAGRRPPAPRRIGGGRRGDPRRRRRGAQRAPPTRLPDPVPRRPRRGRGGGRAGRRGRPRRSPRA